MEKIPVVDTPRFTVYIQDSPIGKIIHGDMHVKWTKSTKAEVLAVVDALCSSMDEPVFAAHYEEQGVKHTKFLKMLGFAPWEFTEDAHDTPCILYRRYARGKHF